MLANYGYSDGTGDYFITIDTDKCDACARCVPVCPQSVFEVLPDDYEKKVAMVRESLIRRIGYVCPGSKACSKEKADNCHSICPQGAISHSW